ncbi:hypothetical protein [Halocatena marina]|uniref:hypothetical protein n=1 Tax=Halocatena marina TaxID=2934937 RepID=UPI00200CCC9F|nr:hypothetical protein [Halocatena marina]
MSVKDSSMLFGRDLHRSRQFLSLAAAVCFGSLALYGVASIDAVPFLWQLMYVPVLIAVGGAVVNAYLNDGLLVSALSTTGIALAVALAHVITTVITQGLSAILSPFTEFPGGGFYLTLTVVLFGVGVGAFVIGAGTRRIITSLG